MAFEIDKQFVLSVAETAFPYIISINVSLHWVTHVDCGPLRYSQSTYLVLPPKLKAMTVITGKNGKLFRGKLTLLPNPTLLLQ